MNLTIIISRLIKKLQEELIAIEDYKALIKRQLP